MDTYNVPGAEMMGENVKEKLKKIGKEVRLMPLAKIANPGVVEIGDFCQFRDFLLVWGGRGVKIGEYCDIQPHVVVWEADRSRSATASQSGPAPCC